MATVAYTNTGSHPRSIGGKLIMPGETRDVDDVGLIPAPPEPTPEPEPKPAPEPIPDLEPTPEPVKAGSSRGKS